MSRTSDSDYTFQQMLGVCGTNLVSPGWLVLWVTLGLCNVQTLHADDWTATKAEVMRQDGAWWGTVSQQSTLLTHTTCCLRLLLLVCTLLSHTIKAVLHKWFWWGKGELSLDSCHVSSCNHTWLSQTALDLPSSPWVGDCQHYDHYCYYFTVTVISIHCYYYCCGLTWLPQETLQD